MKLKTLVDWELIVLLLFFLHGSFALKYADSSNQRDFLLHSSLVLQICPIAQSNRSNMRDRKKPSQQEQTFSF